MQDVFEKARMLADAIAESQEYQAVQAAEEQVSGDKLATQMIAEIMEQRQKLEDLLTHEQPDHAQIATYGNALKDMEEMVGALPTVKAARQANTAFQQMMRQVNQTIQFIVTGETKEAERCSSGGCDGCAGCGHTH